MLTGTNSEGKASVRLLPGEPWQLKGGIIAKGGSVGGVLTEEMDALFQPPTGAG